MLKELGGLADPVTLVPDSGIQFIDLGVDVDRVRTRDWAFAERSEGAGAEAVHDIWLLEEDPDTGETWQTLPDGDRRRVDPSYSVSLRHVLDMVRDKWLPIPMFRHAPPDRFDQGPTNWARLRVVDLVHGFGGRDPQGHSHRLVLAFDTRLHEPPAEGFATAPAPDDARAGRLFALVHRYEDLQFLLSQAWCEQWLWEIFKERAEARARRRLSDAEVAAEMDGRLDHIAAYLALLRFLHDEVAPPRVTFLDTVSEPGLTPIDVDLVLDVGNSRTCGILIEADPDRGTNLNDAYRLELRDLSRPELVTAEPFDSRLEFAAASFGRDGLSHQSGRGDAFVWPTIARVGPEAAWLAGRRTGTEGNTGMSSPKRYLWDDTPRLQNWRFNSRADTGAPEPFANQGLFAQLVNEAGVPLAALEPDDPARLPAVRALYSRSALMSFVLAEIFQHALCMINAPAQRGRRPHSRVPRRLRRIILTMPTALPVAERRILEARARAAIDLLWAALDRRDPPPAVDLDWDEASCTQLVYLYTEVARNFAGDARAFFHTLRRPRLQGDDGETLRLASLDIGGGTTDLIITDYRVEGRGVAVTLRPEERFREGFNLAGDDLLLRVIRRHVLPAIEAAMAESGVDAAEALTTELFGGERGDEKIEARTRRQQFALQIAAPIGLALLGACEQYDPLDPPVTETRTVADFFGPDQTPAPGLLAYVDQAVARAGGQDFALARVPVTIDAGAVNDTCRAMLDDVLPFLAEAVNAYHCDLLLLSGRPSRLPAVRQSLLAALPLPPDRIVPLHAYRVGTWYPFRDTRARIADPKTTAVVGAMVLSLAGAHLPDFAFRSGRLRPRSTARQIGLLDAKGQLLDQDVYFRDVDLDNPDYDLPETPIEFRRQVALGFRQLAIERWPATRLYILDYAHAQAREQLAQRTPLHVTLRHLAKDSGNPERLVIRQVRDANDKNVPAAQLTLRLQTLGAAEGYWLDTGNLKQA